MATFAPQPSEFEYPYWDTRVAYDTSLEAAINANEQKANAAKGVADRAVPKGSEVTGITDANDLITTAVHRVISPTTLENNFPVAGTYGVLEVIERDFSGSVMQRYFSMSGLGSGTGFWVRLRISSGVWKEWSFYPQQRINKTAGLALYTYDPQANREQRFYGDTGVRDITALFPEITSGAVRISRQGLMVSLTLNDVVLGGQTGVVALTALPAGFWPANTENAVVTATSVAFARGQVQTTGVIRFLSLTNSSIVNGTLIWRTNQTWPTTLPGTAIGTIPQL